MDTTYENKYIYNTGKDIIYIVEDLMRILKIGRNMAYNLIKTNGFPVIKIRNQFRIPANRLNG